MQELLFRDFTADEESQIEEARRQSKAVTLKRGFGKPTFKIDAALHEKRIEMAVNINGKTESFKVDQGQFFGSVDPSLWRRPNRTVGRVAEALR